MSNRLEGKTALVTGGGRGIGEAICKRFTEAGASVVVANRTLELAEKVRDEIREAGGVAECIQLDVDGADRIKAAVAETVAAFGGLDIAVHNAGVCPWTRIEDLDDDTLEQTLGVNLKPCFWLTQAALPHFKARGAGRILVTSSVTGPHVALPGAVHYAAAKAGVNGFVRGAALELAPHAVTVNAIEPGLIAKPHRGAVANTDNRESVEQHIPLGTLGEPDDIAHAMVYLASDEARYVTGQCWSIDGGSMLVENPEFIRRTPKEG